ncbi:flavocytochrome c sulfide dehydrogenase flavin-binding protein [Methylomonas lenta]|uniref:Flavocytochrome c sulfide dehydrogenase flavin-binding protein n=1 Tax=Methylomonas lenta TaxID=980561 RepID=A0A177NJZ5_9GAMM|nr:NAD(P)/FAD-dependent oxidoreductase [Methylomonas lenta]OAI18446.1 flavocytochrome c sulfide dehydrogenase flavin-binding protein [Methylomonas lenta]
MAGLSRRQFLQAAVAGVLPLSGCRKWLQTATKAHVVVVGGGFAGATVAKTLRLLDSAIKVTIIEPKSYYITCPASNWLFADLITQQQLSVSYQALKDNYAVDILTDRVAVIESARRRICLASGQQISYDRLILSPGISFRWDSIAGYDAQVAEIFPHAWQAGPQTQLLQQQMHAMPKGGVILIAAPPDPYRCPPGPYERASMMAYWLKQHNPRGKIIILDPKRSFSKQALFEAGWAKYYGYGTANSLIEWHSLADNPITQLDVASRTVISDFGDRFTADVLNIIPPQLAADIAVQTELTDESGWCPVRPESSQSLFDDFIHVIGDAAHFAPIPKSAFAANSEAKACALAVVALLNDKSIASPNWLNTCYSLVSPEHGISVAGVYKLDADKTVSAVVGAGGVSHSSVAGYRLQEAEYARIAYRSLVNNSFF